MYFKQGIADNISTGFSSAPSQHWHPGVPHRRWPAHKHRWLQPSPVGNSASMSSLRVPDHSSRHRHDIDPLYCLWEPRKKRSLSRQMELWSHMFNPKATNIAPSHCTLYTTTAEKSTESGRFDTTSFREHVFQPASAGQRADAGRSSQSTGHQFDHPHWLWAIQNPIFSA